MSVFVSLSSRIKPISKIVNTQVTNSSYSEFDFFLEIYHEIHKNARGEEKIATKNTKKHEKKNKSVLSQ